MYPRTFSDAFSSGVGSGLEYLAQNKLQQLAQNQQLHNTAKMLMGSAPELTYDNAMALAAQGNQAIIPYFQQPASQRAALMGNMVTPQQQAGPQMQGSPLMQQQPTAPRLTEEQQQGLLKMLTNPKELLAKAQQPGGLSELNKLLVPQQQMSMPSAGMPQARPQMQQPQQMQGMQQPQMMPQQPQQAPGYGGLQLPASPQKGIAQQKLEIEKQKLSEKERTKRQESINKANAPYLAQIDKAVALGDEMESIASEMKALLDTGNVSSGVKGTLPTIVQSSESQRFQALANELAALLAAQGTGVATNFKIKLAQERKPNLTQKRDTQYALIKDIFDKSNKLKSIEQARNEIISENGGEQPANIKSLIQKRIASQKKSQQSDFAANIDDLKAMNLPVGTQVLDEETGETLYWDGYQLVNKGV